MYRLVHFNPKKNCKKMHKFKQQEKFQKIQQRDNHRCWARYSDVATGVYGFVYYGIFIRFFLFSFNVTSNAKRRLVLTLLHPIYMENKPTKLLTYYSYVWITLSHKSLYYPTSFTFRILNTEILFAILTFYQFTGII